LGKVKNGEERRKREREREREKEGKSLNNKIVSYR